MTLDPAAAEPLRGVRAVYLVGDQPLHLRSVLKDTPLFAAVHDVLASGGLVAAVGGSAAALCDPMVDPRGGAFTLGLGLLFTTAMVSATRKRRYGRCVVGGFLIGWVFMTRPFDAVLWAGAVVVGVAWVHRRELGECRSPRLSQEVDRRQECDEERDIGVADEGERRTADATELERGRDGAAGDPTITVPTEVWTEIGPMPIGLAA